MHIQPGFFTLLPREMRDIIYERYLTAKEGYLYNHETGQLVAVNRQATSGQRIDLAFAYTCRQAAAEMQGLALTLNTIYFTTAYSDELRSRAGLYEVLLQILKAMKSGLLSAVHECIDADTVARVAENYPHFLPVVRRLQEVGPIHEITHNSWGEIPSLHRQFLSGTLDLMSQHPDFTNAVSNSISAQWLCDRLPEILSLDDSPWNMPSNGDVLNICHVLGKEPESPDYWERTKYRFSAASVAIQFLGTLPIKSRWQIRQIVLEENHVFVAWPECHAQGLIRFCQENLALRVERRVGLWRNALPAGSDPIYAVAQSVPGYLDRLRSDHISDRCLAPRIMEALALARLGMPPQSFALVLDGEPTPKKSAQVFDVVKRDAAWQAAFEAHCSEKAIAPSWFEMRGNRSYIMVGFPEAIKAITNRDTVIKCNFDLGNAWGPVELARNGRSWSLQDWARNWRMHEPQDFHTDSPLPHWLDLRKEDALPQ